MGWITSAQVTSNNIIGVATSGAQAGQPIAMNLTTGTADTFKISGEYKAS